MVGVRFLFWVAVALAVAQALGLVAYVLSLI